MWKFLIVFFVVFISFASQAEAGKYDSVQKAEVHVSDVMKVLQQNYFEAETLLMGPEKNMEHMKKLIRQMSDNYNKIKSLNQNKKLHHSLKGLKKQIRDLEKAAKKDDLDRMKKTFGKMYMTCFKCHAVHRNNADPD